MIAGSPAMRPVLDVIARVGPSDANVLITGENGTGKGVVARALHAASPRAARPFVTLNAGGISEGVFESELFGHVKGAFTDARADRVGRFELADGGTLFLDEIGNVPASPAGQAPARARDRRVRAGRLLAHVGAATSAILSATNADLPRRGRGRTLPPGPALPAQHDRDPRARALRERREDIPAARPALPRRATPRRYRKSVAGLRARGPRGAARPPAGRATSASSTTPSSAPSSWPPASAIRAGDLGLRAAATPRGSRTSRSRRSRACSCARPWTASAAT